MGKRDRERVDSSKKDEPDQRGELEEDRVEDLELDEEKAKDIRAAGTYKITNAWPKKIDT
jgi:hypothetical protein